MSNKIVRGLTIDNGGSEVRALPLGQIAPAGVTKITNDFVSISEKDFRVKDTTDKKELCRVIKAPKKEYVGIVACGLTGKLYDGESIAIESGDSKTGNINFYRQFIFAVARDALAAEMNDSPKFPVVKNGLFGRKKETGEFEPNVYHYALVTCIPIKEHSGNKDCAALLKENIKGEYVVEFPLMEGSPTVTFILSQEFIGVVPEGGVAIIALRKELKEEEVSIVVDMGHITADYALFKGTSLLGKVISSGYAGSTLIANVRAALADEGYVLSDQQTMKVIETGRVKVGAKEKDVSDIIAAQKEFFVKNYMKKDIGDLLRMNATNANQIQNFIPIGAGMNEAKQQGSIKKAVVEFCGFKDANVKILSEDLRYVNVEMASTFTKKLTDALNKNMLA